MKTCTKCKTKYPATTEYFHRNRTCKGGLSTICKVCINSHNKKKYAKGERKCHYKRRRNPNNIKIKPMARAIPYGKKPTEALDKTEIENLSFKEGKTYLVKYKPDGRGGHKPITFKGKLIHQTKDFITLQNKNGIRESFLKVDFMTGTQIKEVIK